MFSVRLQRGEHLLIEGMSQDDATTKKNNRKTGKTVPDVYPTGPSTPRKKMNVRVKEFKNDL